jgi:hypothetical protein
MKFYKYYLFLLFITQVSASDHLTNGMQVTNENRSTFATIYTKLGGMPSSIISTGLDSDEYFGLWGNGRGISKYKLGNSPVSLDKWKLKRWPQELQNKKIASMYELGSDPEFAKEYAYKPANSNPIGKQPAVMGCLAQHPLRYGDLNKDGKDELVLFLGYESQVLDIVMFNPEKEKIQFSARAIFTDVSDGYALSDRFKYQYSSQFNLNKGHYVGTKTYAKIFMGEFDGNESSPDIIVWRKHYTSLSKNTSTKGFKLASQNYQFYTLKEGEYQLQISLEAQIENWMSETELTWSKGYPSKSECAGQEGQLIPEMHDPLLNDPDVLK